LTEIWYGYILGDFSRTLLATLLCFQSGVSKLDGAKLIQVFFQASHGKYPENGPLVIIETALFIALNSLPPPKKKRRLGKST
jgi:hypothetical protein